MSKPWIFMGVDRSHFSAKLRPALRYKEIHHVEYPPDNQQIAERTGVGFVPVLFSPEDEVFQDTTDIIDVLEERFPEPPLIPEGTDGVLCRLFELYADEFFPTVSMRTRWAYEENEQELRRAFGAFSGDAARGNTVADLMSSYLPMLGVTAETIPAIDAHTDAMLAALDAHFAEHPFLLGERMSLADCTLMGPLYAHLYLDRVTRKKLYDDALQVCMWIERCNRPVPGQMGEWFKGNYPDTLKNVLSLIGADAAPLLRSLEDVYAEWCASNATPGEKAPRGITQYKSTLRNVPFAAAVRTYVAWKTQRLRSRHAADDAETQRQNREVLAAAGCEALLEAPDGAAPLQKSGFELIFS
ncbi:MAG: glutathione S-transferase family protein [Pseudomonadota bacterium]